MHRKHLLFIAATFLYIGQCCGQSILQKESELFSSLEALAGWDWDLSQETDIDSLVRATSEQLTKVLETKVYDEDDSIENLNITISPDGLMRVYTFSFYSGGTRGDVNNSVVQHQLSKGKYLVVASDIEASFYQIHKLPSSTKTLYLLIGEETGESKLLVGIAKTIEISTDAIDLDYLGFAGKYPTLLYFDHLNSEESNCFACIEYNPNSRELEFGVMGEDDRMRGWEGKDFVEIDKLAFRHLLFKNDQFIVQKKK